MSAFPIDLRLATPADAPALRLLHRASLWGLGVFDYSLDQIESIIRHVQTLDPALLESGRYFIATVDGELAGSGGWSDQPHPHSLLPRPANTNGPGTAVPPTAKMRAIFVNPKYARHGIGRALMARAEAEAGAAGFTIAELLATLTSVRLCQRAGYEAVQAVRMPLADGAQLDFVHMRKKIGQRLGNQAA